MRRTPRSTFARLLFEVRERVRLPFSQVRLNLTELRQRGGMTGSHALLVSAMPPVGAPLFAFAAPFMCLEDKVSLSER